MKSTVSKLALVACAAFQFVPAAAQAQDNAAPQANSNEPAAGTQAAAVQNEQVASASTAAGQGEALITITGSRTITNGNDAPTPLTVVTPDTLLSTRPGRIFEALTDLPVFSGSRGVTSQASNAQPNASSSVSALNLRNLGGLRALALFDGRRLPPATADGFTNIAIVPQLLLQRVDIVTGGASAVYGSDAVTGVVNFITDRNFSGVRLHAQNGISRYRDNYSYDVGIAAGSDILGGRAHIEASYQRVSSDGIPHRRDRPWYTDGYVTLQGNGTTVPYHLQEDVRIAFATFGGLIVCPANFTGFRPGDCPARPLVGQTFDQNGVLSPFEVGLTGVANGLTDATIQIGGDGAYHTWPSLISRNLVDQFFARFDVDLTDNLHFFVQGSYTRDEVSGNPTNLRFFGRGVNISACNAFLAPAYQTALGCTNPNAAVPPSFTFNKIFNFELGSNVNGAEMQSIAQTYFIMAGFEGEVGLFGDQFRWELGYTRSTSQFRLNVNRNMSLRNTYAALDAVVDPATGGIVCRVTLTNPTLYPGCVPINVFGPSAESAAADAYIFNQVWHETTHDLDDVSLSIAGSPFGLWAGPVQFALSGEYRHNVYSLITNSPSTLTQDCVGLRYNCTPGVTSVNINQFGARSPVSQEVVEGAAEVTIPILRDQPFFRDFNVNAAARYTHYSNDPGNATNLAARSFNAFTWKIGGTWDVVEWLTFRAARSRDIRAPNLFDLYSPVAINPNSFTQDFFQVPAVTVNLPLQSGGNPDLDPERADTLTLGVVIRPTSRLSFSFDYYDIRIRDALGQLNGQTQAVQQACIASAGASGLCDLIVTANGTYVPGGGNRLVLVYNRAVNIAEQRARGFDFEANFRTEIANRPFSLRALVTYQPDLIYSQELLPTQNQAGASYNPVYGGAQGLFPTPKWKAALFARIALSDTFTLDILERWRSSISHVPEQTPALLSTGRIASVAYTSITGTFTIPTSHGEFQFFMNIQNLFDTEPPQAGTPGQQTQPGLPPNGYVFGDDVVGRYYTVGARVRF